MVLTIRFPISKNWRDIHLPTRLQTPCKENWIYLVFYDFLSDTKSSHTVFEWKVWNVILNSTYIYIYVLWIHVPTFLKYCHIRGFVCSKNQHSTLKGWSIFFLQEPLTQREIKTHSRTTSFCFWNCVPLHPLN